VGGREERPAMQDGGVDEMKEAETEGHEWCLYTKPLLTWLARADGGRKRWVLTREKFTGGPSASQRVSFKFPNFKQYISEFLNLALGVI
jgi:hypothetical protein